MAGIAGLKAAREAEYEKILSKISSHSHERKIVAYKLNSAIKYESHVRNEKHKELQTMLSTITATSSEK